jgi:hypothetical protein
MLFKALASVKYKPSKKNSILFTLKTTPKADVEDPPLEEYSIFGVYPPQADCQRLAVPLKAGRLRLWTP